MRLHTAAAAVAVCLLVILAAANTAAAAAADPDQPQAQPLPAATTSSTTSKAPASGSSSQAAAHLKDLSSSRPVSKSSRQPPASVRQPKALTCPTQVEELNPGADFAVNAAAANVTYLLRPGTYWINDTIILDAADTVTCFRGLKSARRAADGPAVQISVGGTIETNGRTFVVNGGAGLVLEDILLDGQGSQSGGVFVAGSALEVNRVTMQRFSTLTGGGFGGFGGAICLQDDSTARISQTTFDRNSAIRGGAVFVSTDASVAFEGVKFNTNSASDFGGGIYASGSVRFSDSLCATLNTASARGGFAYVQGGTLAFDQDARANLSLNTPDAVTVVAGQGLVTGGTSRDSWAANAPDAGEISFRITGEASACNSEFISSTGLIQTCDSCNGQGLDLATCACAREASRGEPRAQCSTLGQGCCHQSGLYSPAGTVCRHRRGSCDTPEVCSGSSATCPTDVKLPNGTPCRKLVALDADHEKHNYYPGYTEATVQTAAETQRYRQPHRRPEHHRDNSYAHNPQYEHEYPQHSKYRNSWADQGLRWAKDCMGTCRAGMCHVSSYDMKQCAGGY